MMSLERLPNMQPGETPVLFLRRYWLDLFKIFFNALVLLLLPIAAGIVIVFFEIDLSTGSFLGPIMRLALTAYLMIVLIVTITELTDYWLDSWIVTTERIISTEQFGLFKRIVSELPLVQVEDVTAETSGFLETFMTFGDVYVQTAGERERFQFKNVNNPEEVKETIIRLWQTCKTQHHHRLTDRQEEKLGE